MLAEITLLAAMCTGQVCYGQPAYGPTVYVAPPVHHHIINQGVERSRHYVRVQLPDGYRTQIPVINGMLPSIKQQKYNGRTVRLTLNYSCKITYNRKMYSGSYIHYRKSKAGCEDNKGRAPAPAPHGKSPTPAPLPKAPAPKPPLDLRGGEEKGIGEIPEDVKPLREETPKLEKAPGIKPLSIDSDLRGSLERLKKISKQLEDTQKLINPHKSVTLPRMAVDDNLDFSRAFLNSEPKMMRPSDVEEGTGLHPSYPRYE